MTNLSEYNNDGANYQAQGVLAFLRHISIEESWDKKFLKYNAEFKVGRWENGREQGYVIVLRTWEIGKFKQLNIAFFEHRNSDNKLINLIVNRKKNM